jgi:hypothetical protein
MSIIGNKFLLDFGMAKVTFHLESSTSLTFTITEKNGKEVNETETVAITLTELKPQLYMAIWDEKNGNSVTQIQDYEQGLVYNHWISPKGEFVHAQGTLKPLPE